MGPVRRRSVARTSPSVATARWSRWPEAGRGRWRRGTWARAGGSLASDGTATPSLPAAPRSAGPPLPWPSGVATGSTSARWRGPPRGFGADAAGAPYVAGAGAHDQPTDHRHGRRPARRRRRPGAARRRPPRGRLLWAAGGDTSEVSGCHQLAVSAKARASYCGTETGQVVVRDLDTGERAGRLLEPQLGKIGSLVVDGSEARPAGVQRRGCRRSPDGVSTARVSAATLLAPGRVATGGYDPTGRLLLVSRPAGRASEVVDADTGTSVLRLRVRARPSGCRRTRSVCRVDGPSWSTSRRATCARSDSRARPRPCTPSPAGSHAWAVSRHG